MPSGPPLWDQAQGKEDSDYEQKEKKAEAPDPQTAAR